MKGFNFWKPVVSILFTQTREPNNHIPTSIQYIHRDKWQGSNRKGYRWSKMIVRLRKNAKEGMEMSESPELKDIPPLPDLTDEELVRAHREGRPGAFRELYGRYQGRLSHFIRKRTGASERVQDLLQETWVRVARHLHRFDAGRKFSTWIYTITANLCKNELRNRSRSRMVSMGTLEARRDSEREPIQFEDLSFLPDRLYEKREARALVEKTVESLPQHHREVFQLREIKGRSYQSVADTLGIRLGTVKSRLHRARTEFAQRIAPLVDAEPPAHRDKRPHK